MSDKSQQVGSSLLAIEANVIIAGLPGIALAWIFCRFVTTQPLYLPSNFDSGWSGGEYAIYSAYALLAVVMVGFAMEGLAGLIEEKIVSHWKCYKDTKAPDESQQYIWESGQAHKDFSRRRLRILVTRNTAFFFVALSVVLLIIFVTNYRCLDALVVLFGSTLFSALFIHLWIDARKSYKNDIKNIKAIGRVAQAALDEALKSH